MVMTFLVLLKRGLRIIKIIYVVYIAQNYISLERLLCAGDP